MTGPTAHAPPAPGSVSAAPAALGVLPGAPPPPARPLGPKGSFLKPPPTAAGRPQEYALGPPASPPDAMCACATPGGALGVAALPDSQTPHPAFRAGWHPSGSGSDCSPAPKRLPVPQCTPSFLPKDPLVPRPWRPASGVCSLLPFPSPQHPPLCLPAVTVEGIWYETKNKTKLDICNTCLSVSVGLARPSEAQ